MRRIFGSSLYWICAAVVTVVAVGAYGFGVRFAVRGIAEVFEAEYVAQLEAQARLMGAEVARLGRIDGDSIDTRCKDIGRALSVRVTWISADGTVLGDSESDPSQLNNHADRPEIIEAYAGRRGVARRYSDSIGEQYLYVAVPVDVGGERAVLRMSITAHSIEDRVRAFSSRFSVGFIPVVLASLVASFFLVRPAFRFLRSIREAAIRISRKDLDHRVGVPGVGTFAEAATALNRMFERTQERFRTVEVERRDNAALLASMSEGVLAVDGEERVAVINSKAREILGLRDDHAIGRGLPEVIRNTDLLRLVRAALAEPGEVRGMVQVPGPQERFIAASGASWIDPDRGEIGALLVLNDVTHLRRLENLRRDFVANVSHELRTPITSIRGFAETLRDSADVAPEEARRFHEIIARESARLHAMLEDLLTLARVEREADGEDLEIKPVRVQEVIARAVEACSPAAERKSVVLRHLGEDRLAPMHAQLIEQALINLIENAVRHSESGDEVVISADVDGTDMVLGVADRGCGIAAEHLERVFERFYRVSQARGRKDGGTGLGLSIVKHIAEVHGGKVTVTSRVGEGSRFVIRLPLGGKLTGI